MSIEHRDSRCVDATPTHRRLQALAALGHSLAEVCQSAGYSRAWASEILKQDVVLASSAAHVADIYECLCMVVPPAGWVADRGRASAAAKGWVPPLAWDDIDTDPEPPTPEPLGKEFVDEIAVQRAFDGDTTVHLTNADRRAFVTRWLAAGRSYGVLYNDFGLRVERYRERSAA